MPGQQWDANLYDRKHAFVYEYGKDLLVVLAPQPDERILDLGCGTGHLTKAIADAGARVTGLDSSPQMIDKARAAYPGLEFIVADARTFSRPAGFDAIFSNAALHWIREADEVTARIGESLRPGGRLVVELAGRGNVAGICSAVREAAHQLAGVEVEHPWYFPSLAEYVGLLERHGLEPRDATLYDRPTRLEEGQQGLRNWIRMFGSSMLKDISEPARERVIRRAEELARPSLFRDGHWFADYRRLRVVAYRV